MPKGIIYLMSTVVKGLVKIGKTRSDQFVSRKTYLENNGYFNVTGLRCEFAIEVEDYHEKEKLLHNIFSKSRVANSELFALDVHILKELLASFEGDIIYPENESKKQVLKQSIKEEKVFKNNEIVKQVHEVGQVGQTVVPDGEYHLERKVKSFGDVKGTLQVKNGIYYVKKGSICAPANVHAIKNAKVLKEDIIKNNILMKDIPCTSPSTAAIIVIGKSTNGWDVWKDKDGDVIDVYRKGIK